MAKIKRYYRISVGVIASLLCGCTLQYTQSLAQQSAEDTGLVRAVSVKRQQNMVVHPASAVLVARPITDAFSTRLNRQVGRELYEAVAQIYPLAVISQQPLSLSDALTLAGAEGIPFVLYAKPVGYDDNSASIKELSRHWPEDGRLGMDHFNIQVGLYDVYSKRLIDLSLLHAKTGFFSAAGQPESLLKPAFNEYVRQLSGPVWASR